MTKDIDNQIQLDEELLNLVNIGIWPPKMKLDPIGWIGNFQPDEQKLARRLLKNFLYFSQIMTEEMFKSNFQSLSKYILTDKSNFEECVQQWNNFLNNSYIVRVTGEEPSDADSGYTFSRWSRNLLGYDESQLLTPEKALEVLEQQPERLNNFIFVDDFVGSGNQFVDFWHRRWFKNLSFSNFEGKTPSNFFYIPIFATKLGYTNITNNCTGVQIVTCHVLDNTTSALDTNSYIWKDIDFDGISKIQEISRRIGIPMTNGQVIDHGNGTKDVSWNGFHGLGLALAINHSCPDATLPIFYFSSEDWKPLIK